MIYFDTELGMLANTERFELDERDQELVAARQKKRHNLGGIAEGDILILTNGDRRRAAAVYDDSVQPSSGAFPSIHLNSGGTGSFSGGLDRAIPLIHWCCVGIDTADFWIFHHDLPGAGRGVDCKIRVHVWRQESW